MSRIALAAATVVAALTITSSALADTLRVEMPFGLDAIDPALSYTSIAWQIQYATCVKLVNYPDKNGLAGGILQPEAAVGWPHVSRDGLTYRFNVPPGRFRFAPPSDEKVTAQSFLRAFERTLAPGVGSAAVLYAADIEGAAAYSAGTAAAISGLEAKGSDFSISLLHPAPDLLARLAMPFFCAVPSDASPPSTTTVIPGAGPYTVTSADINGTIVLQRNPNYKGKRPSAYAEIDLQVTPDQTTTIDRIAAGTTGYAISLPAGVYATFPRPDAQLFVNPALGLRYLRFNTTRPLFATPSARRAAALALDRTQLSNEFGAGGHTPTDQILPPGMPGYVDRSIFGLGAPGAAQLAEARALLGPGFAATADLYVRNNAVNLAVAADIQAELAQVGIAVVVHAVPIGVLLGLQASDAWDILVNGWISDYDDPNALMNPLVGPGSPNNNGGFFDPVLSPALTAASLLSGDARSSAYADLDLQLSRDALPIAPFGNINNRDVFSLGVSCQTFSPPFGMNLAALCPAQ